MDDRLPPHDTDMEEQVLGALLVDPDAIYTIKSQITPECFYREKNMWVYQACLSCFEKNLPTDQAMVSHQLSESGLLEAAGGAAYTSHLVSNVATSVNIEFYAKVVLNLYRRRLLLQIAQQAEDLAFNEQNADTSFTKVITSLLDSKASKSDMDFVSPSERAKRMQERAWKIYNGEEKSGLKTGFNILDYHGGFQRGEDIKIAGPTGRGKTTLTSQIARYIAKNYGIAGWLSLEMTERQTGTRDLARKLGVPTRVIDQGGWNEKFYEDINQACAKIGDERIWYSNVVEINVPQIYAITRKLQIKEGIELLVVDYLQLVNEVKITGDIFKQMTEVSRGVRKIAKELDIPVVSLTQFSRNKFAERIDKTKGSGAISEDADWLIAIEHGWPEDEEKDEKPKSKYTRMSDVVKGEIDNKATIYIEKHRQGGEHRYQNLLFDNDTQSFSEVG